MNAGMPELIYCAVAQHSSIQICLFTVIRSSASLLSFAAQRDTSPSDSAVIGFHVNWDWSGDQQITSACFSHSQKHTSTHTDTHSHALSLTHTDTHTFTQAWLDCCHGSLPNKDWDDSWNSDIIMHHSRGPRKLFHLTGEKKLVGFFVSNRDS